MGAHHFDLVTRSVEILVRGGGGGVRGTILVSESVHAYRLMILRMIRVCPFGAYAWVCVGYSGVYVGLGSMRMVRTYRRPPVCNNRILDLPCAPVLHIYFP